MVDILDDKSQLCIHFLLEQLGIHEQKYAADSCPPPFFVGLNGVQGAGKTVLVSILRSTLSSPPCNLPTIAFSLDDIYLSHTDQQRLAALHPSNPLLQHRGQPSTHDIPLGCQIFDNLRQGLPTKIPAYDKSAYSGQGDRLPEIEWEVVNDASAGQERVKVVIFEGWCVGFRALPEAELRRVWEDAVQLCVRDPVGYKGRLGYVKFEDVKMINDALRAYDAFTDRLDAFIHLDAEDTHLVYDWRQEQERTLLSTKGAGMTAEQVNKFVDGYYPSYELFVPNLRKGVFAAKQEPAQRPGSTTDDSSWEGKQLRLIVNRQRKVCDVIRI
ncbi:uridine/cytidine kinase [Histoplasma ohiense]|nr:uridine/cytidine kinase [Histoplasma ohiense (nom. inval.)]